VDGDAAGPGGRLHGEAVRRGGQGPDARVRLGDLGISALDFVYAAVPGEAAEASETELRAVLAALAGTGRRPRGGVSRRSGRSADGFPSAPGRRPSCARCSTRAAAPAADLVEPGTAAAAPDAAELTQR
jgi:hypothetical protein